MTGSAATALVEAAGGTVVSDLTGQIGVVVATSSVPAFDAALRASSLVVDAGENLRFQGVPGGGPQRSADSARSCSGTCSRSGPRRPTPCRPARRGSTSASSTAASTATTPDSCDELQRRLRARPRLRPSARRPGVGNPEPCVDNQFHGTHVAGTSPPAANGIGVVGVAPNVTLVPVKVCDAEGYCYASSVIEGITYAGDPSST